MNKLSVFTLICLFFLAGCASKQAEYDSSIAPAQPDSLKSAADTIKQAPAAISVPGLSEPVKTAPVVTTTTPGTTPAIQPKTGAGLNPPHGQPGHDCALAVGAPLNSKPTAAAKTVTPPPIKTEITPVQPAATPVKNPTGAKLNPPHGQPGHDCSIAVGQPLKS